MQLVVWNIRQGGGKRAPQIVEELSARDAAVIALAGYRPQSPDPIADELRDRGWPHIATTQPAAKENGIAVFSTTPLGKTTTRGHRWIEVELPAAGFTLWTLLLPAATDPRKTAEKRRIWDDVLREAERRLPEPWLLTGSWNTGAHLLDEKGKTYVCADHFARLSELGWIDSWRRHHPGETEYTWYSHQGNGFRVDHAFASPPLAARIQDCRYSHRERQAKLSDHSLILLELAADR